MAKPFSELKKKIPQERLDRITKRVEEESKKIRLSQLRALANMTQAELAEQMGITQPAVSQIESGENNLVLETLIRYVKSTGGELEVIAKYPEGSVKLSL